MTSPAASLNKLTIIKTAGHFEDRFSKVHVFEVFGGQNNFAALVYMCRLNLDLDGASNSYGYDNPNSSKQKDLKPLESWHKGWKGVSTATSQKVGLGNACGDPGDGMKGWRNFLDGNRNFYWAGIKAVTKQQAQSLSLTIDDRAELEAGRGARGKKGQPPLLPVGSGYFPVVNQSTGYYISGTSVASDGSLSAYDPNRYLDSSVVPYAVWANNWNTVNVLGKKVRQGDFGLAINPFTGASTVYVYGDSGTQDKVGESSKKLHDALGNPDGSVTFIAFPDSGHGTILGKHPEMRIRIKVLCNMMKLGANANELAERLTMGRELTPPDAGTSLEHPSRLKNYMSAFAAWSTNG